MTLRSWIRKEGFDRNNATVTLCSFLLQTGIAVLGIPLSIRLLTATIYSLVIVFSGGPLGYFAQHTSDKIVGMSSGGNCPHCGLFIAGYLRTDHATSLELDALRGVIFLSIQTFICVLVYWAGAIMEGLT